MPPVNVQQHGFNRSYTVCAELNIVCLSASVGSALPAPLNVSRTVIASVTAGSFASTLLTSDY